jgi:thiol-disulfide isomerase/thioredoxin
MNPIKSLLSLLALTSLLFSGSLKVGDTAPGFDLIHVADGDKKTSMASLKGKTIVLNFWASWCPGCKAEMPDFIELKKSLGKDVEIVAINIDSDRYDGRNFMDDLEEKHGSKFNFEVLYDADKEITNQYKPRGLPSTYIINKRGIITDVFVKSFNKKSIHILKDAITKAL